ncbi:MAG: response regulator [Bacteroidales bacterium]|nr:response regulator [Bacteroidales bacterium]MBN2756034.1 response regulator [Bacteroidales bacterium]
MKSNVHIIIVDDSSTNNLLCKILFEEQDYKVTIIDNGKQAISTIKSTIPDMVLLDLMMPGIDGLAVLRELKTDEKTKNIPIIIVSAADTQAYINEVMKLKPLDYVKKPIGLNDLLGKVEYYLKSMNKI